ncbi:MAG: hypothetical protein HRT74_10620 [Flavobacteriales bacterium]|nr:hypothetical protein [Flavobacteriales bacterium]
MLQSVAEMSMRSVPGTLITLEAYQSSKWEVRVRILDRSPSLPSDYVPVVEEAGANGKTPVQTNPWDLEQVNLNAEMLGAEFTVSRRPQLMGNSYNFVFMTEANWN